MGHPRRHTAPGPALYPVSINRQNDFTINPYLVEEVVVPGIFRIIWILHKAIVGEDVMGKTSVVRVPKTLSIAGNRVCTFSQCKSGRVALDNDARRPAPSDAVSRRETGPGVTG